MHYSYYVLVGYILVMGKKIMCIYTEDKNLVTKLRRQTSHYFIVYLRIFTLYFEKDSKNIFSKCFRACVNFLGLS